MNKKDDKYCTYILLLVQYEAKNNPHRESYRSHSYILKGSHYAISLIFVLSTNLYIILIMSKKYARLYSFNIIKSKSTGQLSGNGQVWSNYNAFYKCAFVYM